MRTSFGPLALFATVLVPAAATATSITVGQTPGLVVDVEFWGRQELRSPGQGNEDIVSYGDPVQGTFRIWTDDAPVPIRTSIFEDVTKAVVYGRDSMPVGNPSPASFVTSRWLSPFPAGFDGISPLSGGTADDYVTIGDGVRFLPDEPLKDWFAVTDSFTERFHEPHEFREQLFVTVNTPLDIIQGLHLEQEFDLSTPADTSHPGHGFFRTKVDGAVKFFEFIVERMSVSKHLVCRP